MNNMINQYDESNQKIIERLELFNSVIMRLNNELEESESDLFIFVSFTLIHRIDILQLSEDYVNIRVWSDDYESEPFVDGDYLLPLYLFEDDITEQEIKDFFIQYQQDQDKKEEREHLLSCLRKGNEYFHVLEQYNKWLAEERRTDIYVNAVYFLDNVCKGEK